MGILESSRGVKIDAVDEILAAVLEARTSFHFVDFGHIEVETAGCTHTEIAPVSVAVPSACSWVYLRRDCRYLQAWSFSFPFPRNCGCGTVDLHVLLTSR